MGWNHQVLCDVCLTRSHRPAPSGVLCRACGFPRIPLGHTFKYWYSSCRNCPAPSQKSKKSTSRSWIHENHQIKYCLVMMFVSLAIETWCPQIFWVTACKILGASAAPPAAASAARRVVEPGLIGIGRSSGDSNCKWLENGWQVSWMMVGKWTVNGWEIVELETGRQANGK